MKKENDEAAPSQTCDHQPFERFKVQARDLGSGPQVPFDKIGELLERFEGLMHR